MSRAVIYPHHPGTPMADSRYSDTIAAFCRLLRAEGYNAGLPETLDALRAARLGVLTDRRAFREALRALLCSSRAEAERFDDLFDRFWSRKGAPDLRGRTHRKPRPIAHEQRGIPLLLIGAGAKEPPDEAGRSTSGAQAVERLQRTDFSQVPIDDQRQLERLVLRLCRQMSLRSARRQRAARRRGRVDLRRTIRRSIATGGDPIDLRYRRRKPRKPRLVALLDVSGSMDRYSFFLFRFIYALQRPFARVDTFLFSTRLVCVNDAVRARRLPATLHHLADVADAWSSGTRIGACLQDFNVTYARDILTRDTLVLVLSDGLDTGEPALLEHELLRIRRRVRKLIWLNPLLGMEGYQPLTRGIRAALPLVDAFLPAHNLESLLRLENHLRHV